MTSAAFDHPLDVGLFGGEHRRAHPDRAAAASACGPRVRAYGLPGLANTGDDDIDEIERAQRRPSKRKGSGVIAPQPYATGYRWGNV